MTGSCSRTHMPLAARQVTVWTLFCALSICGENDRHRKTFAGTHRASKRESCFFAAGRCQGRRNTGLGFPRGHSRNRRIGRRLSTGKPWTFESAGATDAGNTDPAHHIACSTFGYRRCGTGPVQAAQKRRPHFRARRLRYQRIHRCDGGSAL